MQHYYVIKIEQPDIGTTANQLTQDVEMLQRHCKGQMVWNSPSGSSVECQFCGSISWTYSSSSILYIHLRQYQT